METAPLDLFKDSYYTSLIHEFNNDEDKMDKENILKVFYALSWSFIAFYVVFIGATSFNVYYFLIRQHRYKTLIVLLFYLLTYIVLIFRIVCFSMYIVIYNSSTWYGAIVLLNASYMVATFAKVSLGFNQVVSMLELALRLNSAL